MRFAFFLFISLAFISGHVFGQSTNASFAGVITGEKNNRLSGATVELLNESTGFRSTTRSQKDGSYQFLQLPLGGPYSITVSYVGYTTAQKTGYQLNQILRHFSINTGSRAIQP